MTCRLQPRAFVTPALAALPLLVAGCSWVIGDVPQSTVHPMTDAAREIQGVYKQVTYWIMAIFIAVEVLIVYAVIRYRRRPGDEGVPEQVHGHTGLEIGWTLIPLVVVIAIAFPSLRSLWALAAPAPPDALEVKVIGNRWWWQFEYPELGIVTANELHLPAGRTVDLALTSDNIIHSFWVPRLMGKRDLVPGREQRMWFTPEEPGWYEGQCAELCGASHALMRMRVKVETPEAFEQWVARQQEPAQVDMQAPGVQAFQQNACFTCHAIEGTPWTFATIGPNLTHVASRTTIAGAVLENSPENMKRWIRSPGEVKPGHGVKGQAPDLMWSFEHVPEEQLDALVAFLQGLE